MISIAICDDDSMIIEQIQQFIEGYNYKINISKFQSGHDLLDSVNICCDYDLIFLDIEIPGMDGITTAKQLRERNVQSLLVYISSHTDYYYETFETEPFRFINKPIDWILFKKIFELAIERITKLQNFFCFQKDKVISKVLLSDIQYFESERRTIHIKTCNNTYNYYGKLSDVEAILNDYHVVFFRIHKSFIINSAYIKKLEFAKVQMANGDLLPISEKKRTIIRNEYIKYIGGIMCGRD